MSTIDPETSALLLIDLQNDVLRGLDGVLATWVIESKVVESAVRAIESCRGLGIKILWIKVERRLDQIDVPDVETDLILSGRSPSPRSIPRVVAGTRGAALMDEFHPLPNEDVIIKRRVSAFHGTPLDLLLRAYQTKTLLVAGVHTENAVESTVRAAWDHGYACVVLSDCCASPNLAAHRSTLEVTLLRFARILTLPETLRLFESGTASSESHRSARS